MICSLIGDSGIEEGCGDSNPVAKINSDSGATVQQIRTAFSYLTREIVRISRTVAEYQKLQKNFGFPKVFRVSQCQPVSLDIFINLPTMLRDLTSKHETRR